jgi:glycosyltransferase involved in cell wall biosynthesis
LRHSGGSIGMKALAPVTRPGARPELDVALLTGGADSPYAFGLSTVLISNGVHLDVIAGDELDRPEFHGTSSLNFFNLRGDQRPDAGHLTKISRILIYYGRLIRYAFTARPKVFHILWNNKFEFFDRTLLMLYYKLLGKRVVLTVHNVNAGIRDSTDTWLNRLTLRIQYRLADHIFVHTEKMKSELAEDFGILDSVTVIPFGINNAAPNTRLSSAEAKQRLGLGSHERAILFFGNIAPYKGLEYLVAAFQLIVARGGDYRLIIAGRPKSPETYWKAIQRTIDRDIDPERIMLKIEFVSDADTELYFKAADVLALPYTEIFQSGVLFLGYSFGLPVIAADVGSMREDVIEGTTGFLFAKQDPASVAAAIESYFESDLYKSLQDRRTEIRDYAHQRYSWEKVSQMTWNVYQELSRSRS